MTTYLRLAWRNLCRQRRRTLIIVFSIGLGLALMMMYDGMVGGFEQSIYGNAIQVLGGNIQAHAPGYQSRAAQNPLLPLDAADSLVSAARARPEVVTAAKRINTGGLATSRAGAFAVGIYGIEPEAEKAANLVLQRVTAGRLVQADDRDVALIGRGLAEAMGLALGDRFTLAGKATRDQMRTRTLTIIGIYDVGLRELEKKAVYLSLAEAQELYGLTGQVTEVAISLRQIGQEPAVVAALKAAAPNAEIQTWATSFPELQSALAAKGGAMDVFGVIVMVIAGIGILNLLLMAVYERTREIGLLGALGFRPGQIGLMFLLEGALIGLVGLAFGIALGLVLNLTLGQVGLDYSKFASMSEYLALISGKVYPTLGVEKLPQRAITVFVIATLAALLPAREAARSEPARALHFV